MSNEAKARLKNFQTMMTENLDLYKKKQEECSNSRDISYKNAINNRVVMLECFLELSDIIEDALEDKGDVLSSNIDGNESEEDVLNRFKSRRV